MYSSCCKGWDLYLPIYVEKHSDNLMKGNYTLSSTELEQVTLLELFLGALCFVVDSRLAFRSQCTTCTLKIHNTHTRTPKHINPHSHTHTLKDRTRTRTHKCTHTHTYRTSMRINDCTLICNTLQFNVQPLIQYTQRSIIRDT